MRNAFLVGLLVLIFTGCNSTANNATSNNGSTNKTVSSSNNAVNSSIRSPKAVIEKYIANAEKGEIEEMDKAFSDATLQKRGYGVKKDNKTFSDNVKEIGAKEKASIVNLQEKVNGETAQVTLDYRVAKNGVINGKSIGCMAFEMVKESSEWRIKEPAPCL